MRLRTQRYSGLRLVLKQTRLIPPKLAFHSWIFIIFWALLPLRSFVALPVFTFSCSVTISFALFGFLYLTFCMRINLLSLLSRWIANIGRLIFVALWLCGCLLFRSELVCSDVLFFVIIISKPQSVHLEIYLHSHSFCLRSNSDNSIIIITKWETKRMEGVQKSR